MTTPLVEAGILAALATVIDPEIRRPITELDMVGDIRVVDGAASVGIKLTIIGCPAADRIEREPDTRTGRRSGEDPVSTRLLRCLSH